ncbi:PREDICTED: threonylcarbamoyladenosine tRNA methylthiotransferase-like [Miniopterus natalensis]|uniref:threonylcarbamoyladenosine tRNA methylthiotransferase-like n=1 Tax=Miniopterus natalensis TaxID=291302 RepID=UPI0007A6D0F3|nr:PREDICTED: threonylcarbamoyladenosine tRNA methylthiotransferase-like [Miniopterus natalensis]
MIDTAGDIHCKGLADRPAFSCVYLPPLVSADLRETVPCFVKIINVSPSIFLKEMAKILNHPRVYAFLHIPVQSASDSVLMEMKREYCVADFKRVVDFLKEKVPGITIATDIICGFPGETDQDFQETVKLVEEYKFPSLFINQFYPRPGTPAAKMEQVPAQVKKQRTKDLSRVFHSYSPYDHKIGERQQVLVTEESFDSKFYVAHNRFYEQVLVPKNPTFMGKMVEVDIYESGKHFMKGQPVADARVYTPSISKPLAKGEVSGLTEVSAERPLISESFLSSPL